MATEPQQEAIENLTGAFQDFLNARDLRTKEEAGQGLILAIFGKDALAQSPPPQE